MMIMIIGWFSLAERIVANLYVMVEVVFVLRFSFIKQLRAPTD